jgi:hypothetical protein
MGGNERDGSKAEPPVREPSGVADSLQRPSPLTSLHTCRAADSETST